MKKIIFVLLFMVAFVCAKTPMQLVREGACYWPAEKTDKETGEVIIKKGCPRYYTEEGQGCSVKFSTQNLEEDGETFHILIADWSRIEYDAEDGKSKFKGTTKFVVDIRNGEEGLFPYETTIDCKGAYCKIWEQIITPTAAALEEYGLPRTGGLWNRTFSIDKESALYYVNHPVSSKGDGMTLMILAKLGESLNAMDLFSIMMVFSRMECPSLISKTE